MSTILVVTHSASPGGAELGLLRYLRARSATSAHRFHVLIGAAGWLAEALAELDVDVTVVPHSAGPRGTLRATSAVRRLVRELDPGLVLSNSMRAATWVLAARVRRARHVLYVQDLIRGGYFSARRGLLVERVILPSCGYFLWNSEATRASAPPSAAGRSGAVVYTMSGASAAGVSRPVEPTAGSLRVLSMSRLASWKGVHVLLEAVAQVRADAPDLDLEVTVAGGAFFGEEAYRDALLRTVSDEDLPVRMVGHVQDVEPLLDQADVLVHCSVTPEPFGQVIVQALAAGRAVVATRGGGPAEIVQDSIDGLLYDPGDARALATVLMTLARDPDRLQSLCASGRTAASRFTDDAVATLIDDALSDALLTATAEGARTWRASR